MVSVVLATLLTTAAAAPADGTVYYSGGIGAGMAFNVYIPGCHGCHGCRGCTGRGTCACCLYVGPYNLDCCCGFANCRGVVMAQLPQGYGCCCGFPTCCCCGCCGFPTCRCGCCGFPTCCGCWGSSYIVPAPAVVPEEPKREMPKVMPKLPEPIPAPSQTDEAQVLIKAPTDVRILVNGVATERDAAVMTFTTPALRKGKSYSYEVKAEVVRDGKIVAETKQVMVRASEQTVIDFTHLQAPAIVQATARTALVTVNLPVDAKLYVDGAAYTLPANQNTFTTPALSQGKEYVYELKAEVIRNGKTHTETQTVSIEPGKHIKVDFKTLAPAVQTASR